jgi:hypothetical protein
MRLSDHVRVAEAAVPLEGALRRQLVVQDFLRPDQRRCHGHARRPFCGWLGNAVFWLGRSYLEVPGSDLYFVVRMTAGDLAASCARRRVGQSHGPLWLLQERIQFSPEDKHVELAGRTLEARLVGST